MKKAEWSYEPHLVVGEFSVLPGAEWAPRKAGWSLTQVTQGTGYCLQPELSCELEPGSVVLAAGSVPKSIRASQLGGLSLVSFNIIPSRLTGLITLSEQDALASAALRPEFVLRVFPPSDPVAVKMKALCAEGRSNGLLFRLNLLRLFFEAFGGEWLRAEVKVETANSKERLRLLLKRTPPAELLEMSLEELAQNTHCTLRHLSRIFRELVGMSFRAKRAELRLMRARDLLATSQSKVVEVALASGYRSLSLFNIMFTRHFGTSPGRWRQKYQTHGRNGRNGKAKG